jgi:predicted GIY-YIG superfamily endonuclease
MDRRFIMFFFVYLIKCKNPNNLKKSFYCGYTNNPERRKREHFNPNDKNGAKYCKSHIPLEMRVIFKCKERSDAMRCESRLKKNPMNSNIHYSYPGGW